MQKIKTNTHNKSKITPVGATIGRPHSKGITLIALIITIIVMLILVGVSVTVALQGGLFNTAKDAATKTADAARQETEMLRYEYEIASATGETTASFDEYVLETKYGLKIGDKVNYDEGTGHTTTPDRNKGAEVSATYNSATKKYDFTTKEYKVEETGNLDWRVLGVTDNGQLELISTKPTTESLCLGGKEGYINSKSNLDTFCNDLYGKGYGAETARSLTFEDINELGNYDSKSYNGREINGGVYDKYGTKYTYQYDPAINKVRGIKSTEKAKDISEWVDTRDSSLDGIKWVIDSMNQGAQELEMTYYRYNIDDQVKIKTRDGKNMSDIIDNGEDGTKQIDQWYNTRSVLCCEDIAYFCVRCNDMDSDCGILYYFNKTNEIWGFKVRPVVTLKPDVKLTDDNSDGVWEIE